MVPARRIALTLAALGLALGSGCANEGSGRGQEGNGASLVPLTRVGFYAFDGTGMDYATDPDSVIRAMYDRARVHTKAYFEGPDLSGSLTRSIVERGKIRICNDWRSGQIDAVALAGYSRGAVISLAIAYELHLDGEGAPQGCSNVNAGLARLASNHPPVTPASILSNLFRYIGRSDKPVIASLALLDAVNTGNADMGADMLPRLKALSPSTRCFHYAKKKRNEAPFGALNTLGLDSNLCETKDGAEGVDHGRLASDRNALAELEARSLGGNLQFVDSPRVEPLGAADYTALCTQVRPSSVSAGDGYERCLKSLCSWDGRVAGEGTCRPPERIIVRFPDVPDTARKGTGSYSQAVYRKDRTE